MHDGVSSLVFKVTNVEKFKEFYQEVFVLTPEATAKASEKYGGYAYACSSEDMSKGEDLREELLCLYEKRLGVMCEDDDDEDLKRIDEINKELLRG